MSVIFDYISWSVRYPELASSVSAALAQMYFNEAQLYCDNTDSSVITDDSVGGQRSILLNMLVSHIALLNAPLNGQSSQALTGRISSASEGSVSVSVENNYPPGTVQWYQQTKYGSAYWGATSRYRTARYVPGPHRVMDPWRPR